MDSHPVPRGVDRQRGPPGRPLPADPPLRPAGRLPQPARPRHPRPQPAHRPPHFRGVLMIWVTRARPKTDRIACPWLIRRFIDPDAAIVYVPADQVLTTATEHGGHSFDAPGATYTHQPAPDRHGERCTFETLIPTHHL